MKCTKNWTSLLDYKQISDEAEKPRRSVARWLIIHDYAQSFDHHFCGTILIWHQRLVSHLVPYRRQNGRKESCSCGRHYTIIENNTWHDLRHWLPRQSDLVMDRLATITKWEDLTGFLTLIMMIGCSLGTLGKSEWLLLWILSVSRRMSHTPVTNNLNKC